MKYGWFRLGISGLMLLSLFTVYASSNSINPAVQQNVSSQEFTLIESSQPVVQNRKERQLVLLFQALLQMERKDGLSISRGQAAVLLPLIRSIRDQGNLTADQQKQVIELLNDDQQSFYNDLAAFKMNDRMNGGESSDFDHLTQEERDKLIEQFNERRNHQPPGTDNKGTRGEGESEGPSGQDLGKSMEQQLIDLLESKAKL